MSRWGDSRIRHDEELCEKSDGCGCPCADCESCDADDDDSVQCWHIEFGSPCDWNICRQPERLARGDRGTDPKTSAKD